MTDEDLNIYVGDVLDAFTNDHFDPTLPQEYKTITYTQEQKNKVCDEAKSLFKTSDVLEQKKIYIKYQLIICQETKSMKNI